jgi:hypothetical protein
MYIGESLTPLNQNSQSGMKSWLKNQIHRPVFAYLAEKRWHGLLIVLLFTIYFILILNKIEIWHCPMKIVLDVRCPGCGLGTAILNFVHGEWSVMLNQHAFAPFFAAGMVILLIVSLLPERLRVHTVEYIAHFEKRTGFITYYLIVFVLYWIVRLIIRI